MTVEEFENLDEVEQARVRVHTFMANKQLGQLFLASHYVKSDVALSERRKHVARTTRVILDAAGESFLGRTNGYFELLELVSESTGWDRLMVSSALRSYLKGYTINLARGTIVLSSN